MHHELVIEGRIYTSGSIQQCCIGIDEGKISAIKKILHGSKKIHFPHHIVLPTAIDCHVHFRDPGLRQKETFVTGSTAAVFGGVSCVFDMPNTIPVTDSIVRIREKKEYIINNSLVDFGIYAIVTDENINQLSEMEHYCNGFKIFLGKTTQAHSITLSNLKTIFETINPHTPILFHAEDSTCLKQHAKTAHSLEEYALTRPSFCERKAIHEVLQRRSGLHNKIHFCHVSSKDAFEILTKHDPSISIGVTPHHALLNFKIINKTKQPQTYYKMNPPIRPPTDQAAVFSHLSNGLVDMIESDHAPHTYQEKQVDFPLAPAGVPGVETMYPLFLSLAFHQKLDLSRVIALLCEHPAEMLQLSKGRIKEDFDADFAVINYKKHEIISSEKLHSKAGWTPFDQWPAIFPQKVYIRGEPVVDEDELLVKPGYGKAISSFHDREKK